MNFFEHQEKARKATAWLALVYALFVAAIVLCVHLVVSVAVFAMREDDAGGEAAGELAGVVLDPEVLLWSVGITSAIILFATLYKMAQLRQGGSAVAQAMGGREVSHNTRDHKERRLLNIVEEMSLASGVAMPHVFVLDNERGINAFAAGFSTNDAAVAVTRGALDLFNREELQAVIGHEFSHILNGDMRLNIKAVGVLFGILCISMAGSIIVRIGIRTLQSGGGRRRSKNDNSAGLALGLMLFGAAIWLIGSLGVLCARIMQAAISRQRERLADASAVQFTRNPQGMANSLKLIGAYPHRGHIETARASEISHMLFASGFSAQLFATHPPILARIQAIEPGFDGDFSETAKIIARRKQRQAASEEELEEEAMLHRAVLAGVVIAGEEGLGAAGAPEQTAQAQATAQPGVDKAMPWLDDDGRDSVRTTDGAKACIFASVLSGSGDVREAQMRSITQGRDAGFAEMVGVWAERLSSMDAPVKRVTCESAVNTLRSLPKREISELAAEIDGLVRADSRIDAFEFALLRMFRSRLMPDVANSKGRAANPASLVKEASFVLYVLANFGSPDRAVAVAAWQAGTGRLAQTFGASSPEEPSNFNDLGQFDSSLAALVRLPPMAKREFMEACKATVEHDGATTDTEYNFLYAIADGIEASGWNAEVPPPSTSPSSRR